MKRLQISIEPELDAAVERVARAEGISKAELIRRCVRSEVEPLPPLEEDPLFQMSGSVEGAHDWSETIDDTVYGPRE